MTIGQFITVAVIGFYLAVIIFVIALCRAAAKADRDLERMERERRAKEDESC